MTLYSIIKTSLVATLFIGVSSIASANVQKKHALAPVATADEAQIVYWNMPDIDREFFDIPELKNAYFSGSPTDRHDGISVGQLGVDGGNKSLIVKLAQEISDGKHGKVDSLLIAQNDQLLFESYYLRGRVNLPHPQSSASKVYVSTVLGRAIQLGYLSMADLDKPLVSFLKDLDPTKFTKGAEKITLRHALTMRSGIRITQAQWDEWDKTEKKPASLKGQGLLQSYLELSAPITAESQTFKYQNDPMLVMQVIEAVVPGSAKDFIKKELLDKMGIITYGWRADEVSGLPGSASMTSRAMVKFGTLARNMGKWNGEQLIPEVFIKNATQRIIYTGDDDIFGGGKDVSNQGYGFFWWGTDLKYGNKSYYSVSAQGGGGIFIFIIDELDLTVVVTAHDLEHTTQQLIAERVLPAFVRN